MQIVGYKEYTKEVAKEFPDVDFKSIENVVRHGLSMLAVFKKNNHDIYLNNNRKGFYMYLGEITDNTTISKLICRRKLRRKLRYVYSLKKTIFSGEYYFSIDANTYENKYLSNRIIPRAYLYKIIDEARLYTIHTHLFKVRGEDNHRWLEMKEEYDASDAELIEVKKNI